METFASNVSKAVDDPFRLVRRFVLIWDLEELKGSSESTATIEND